MPKNRVYFKKGYCIIFNDGEHLLVNKMQRVSYEEVMILGERQLIHMNTDYIVYSNALTKYGLIPIGSIKQLFEVKFQKGKDGWHVFDATGKEIMTQ